MKYYYIPVIILSVLLFLFILFVIAEIRHHKGTCKKAPDFLLILGCRVRGDKAEQTLQMRIEAAAEYLKQNKSTIAIPCGGIVHADQTKSEASVIADTLVEMGIEKDRIISEDKSLTTVQNFINAKNIIDNKFNSKGEIAFLSSDFHLFRAAVIAKKCGVKAKSVAAPSPQNLKIKNYLREFIVFPGIIIKGK